MRILESNSKDEYTTSEKDVEMDDQNAHIAIDDQEQNGIQQLSMQQILAPDTTTQYPNTTNDFNQSTERSVVNVVAQDPLLEIFAI